MGLKAMHEIKKAAYNIKVSLLKGSIPELAYGLRSSWEAKKATSKTITNNQIQKIEQNVISAGATSMKVSGAGGGGFVMILTQPESRYDVIKSLENLPGKIVNFQFTLEGVLSWTI